MGSVVNSVFGSGGIGSLVTTAISAIYPPAGIAMGVANLITQGLGSALNDAVSQLTKNFGMPSFLQDPIREMVNSVVKELIQDNSPELNEAAEEGFGKDIRELMGDITKSIVQLASQYIDEEGNVSGGKGGKGSGDSWLVAIAKAMGQISGKHAGRLQELSAEMDKAAAAQTSAQGEAAQKEAATAFTQAQSEFQAESQLFGMLQSSFANALKSIGEGLTQMARKG